MSHAAVVLLCIAQEMMLQRELWDTDFASQTINLGLWKYDEILGENGQKVFWKIHITIFLTVTCISSTSVQYTEIRKTTGSISCFSFTEVFTENVICDITWYLPVSNWRCQDAWLESRMKKPLAIKCYNSSGRKHLAIITDFLSDMLFAGWTQELWVIISHKFRPLFWHYMFL